ncbi:hypothetical protein [Stutzerimonas nitrititolerans]|uniref:hypothetical protein n=1 Tax=Stutzerimonas nitrititolerans TaxID=2482751 RepID=UPI0028A2BD37|nr:hypothetical protein [Stutzerimonas nitrititolerans]
MTTSNRNFIPGIHLERDLKVQCYRVIGEVAKAGKRSELMAVLQRAAEQGERGTDARDIACHLLFDEQSRTVVGQRLLQIAESYCLLERHERSYILTDSGRVALQSGQVFIPEAGVWTVWASDDPLLDYPVLRVEPWREPAAREEVRGKANQEQRRPEELPGWLKRCIGHSGKPAAAAGNALRLDRLEAKGEKVDADSQLRMSWDIRAGTLHLKGSCAQASVDTVLPAPRLTAAQVWQQLLEQQRLWDSWDQVLSALRVSFAETEPVERESMQRVLRISWPQLKGLGTFRATEIRQVPLLAASFEDAEEWAEWRLIERLRDYATCERFATWQQEATAPFTEFDLTMPERAELAQAVLDDESERQTAQDWYLLAAEDWSL